MVLRISLPFPVVLAGVLSVLALAKPAVTGSPLVGKTAPPLRGQAVLNGPVGGGAVTLTSGRGCWVPVNYAASWCIPCRQEMAQLKAFAAEHAAHRDATIITVAYDQSDLPHLRRFQRDWRVGWPVIDQAKPSSTGASPRSPTPTW